MFACKQKNTCLHRRHARSSAHRCALSHGVHKSHTVVSAAAMIHDLLKTKLPSRKEFKSFEESAAMWRFGFHRAGLYAKVHSACFFPWVVDWKLMELNSISQCKRSKGHFSISLINIQYHLYGVKLKDLYGSVAIILSW